MSYHGGVYLNTAVTILSILVIIVGFVYLLVYEQKSKKNTQKDKGYKIIFLVIFIPLFIVDIVLLFI